MNKSFYILFLFLISVVTLCGQENLVPNPSFEELDSCEQIGTFYENGIIDWYNPTEGTSDIFNGCSDFSVPENSLGYQEARTGIGYAGLGTYEDLYFEGQTGWFVDSREYIQVELSNELIEGGKYNLTFFVSAADYFTTCFANGLGAYVSSEAISSNIAFGILDFEAQVFSTVLITDSINWVEISGEFIASGGEKYLTIGNFKMDSQIQINCYPDTVFQRVSYYYIDDVSIHLTSIKYEAVFPNIISPNFDGFNDEFKIETIGYVNTEITIYNRWGTQMFYSSNTEKPWNGENAIEGVYFFEALLQRIDGYTVRQNGFVQLVR